MSRSEPVVALARLLEQERAALLSGDLAQLPALVAGKERLLLALEEATARPDADALDRLKARATANQALLDAALRGVRAARARLETARAGGPALSTYDARGKAESHAPERPSIERRA
ncbi:MAG: flagellar biosynthesis protein FlgN [Paracoccaceae bacterium]|nr:flagellar biosynthesis protein FlgN [Paracoccaceae bacterium]